MSSIEKLKKKNFVVYGLGVTGKSVVNYLRRVNCLLLKGSEQEKV
jgi:UDP-N-acetylmuramoylalanine-D-glutamate ligase